MNLSIIQKRQLEGKNRLDAEYYQPAYLNLVSKFKARHPRFLENLAEGIVCGPFGSAILQKDYRHTGIPLLRVSDLNDWFVHGDDLVFIEESLSQEMKKYQVTDGDIVVSQRGTIAMFSKVTDKFPKWNISANLISIRNSNRINFDYLLAFLNSSYGIGQLYRRLSGQVQPKITTDDVKEILIFVPGQERQQEISLLVNKAWREEENSRFLYIQAEKLLLEEVGLAEFETPQDLAWVVDYSEIEDVERVDSEYFQPKYAVLLEKISKYNSKRLEDVVSIKKGIEPGSSEYQDKGKLFIRVSSLSVNGIEDKDQKYLTDELYQKLKNDYEPRLGEILLTKDATPGIAYVLKEPIEGITSGGILRLKPRVDIDPEYLALCINSMIGQQQTEQDTAGSVIAHWRPAQIKKLLVPILPKKIQQKIGGLIRKTHEARKKSKELLEEAKRKVEEMIEKGSRRNGERTKKTNA